MTSASKAAVVFDQETAGRVIKATRAVEAMARLPLPESNRQSFSIEQIIVPRSGPDGDGLYTCDIYIPNSITGNTYTRVATGQKMRLLPTTIAP